MNQDEFKKSIIPYYPVMLGVALKFFSGQKERAQDAVQDTIASLWTRRNHLAEIENLGSYCIISVRNQCISVIRATPSFENIEEKELADALHDPCEISDTLAQISFCMSKLPQKRREILLMKINGYSCEEIAQKHGLTTENIRQILRRSRMQLQTLLNENKR